jgi:hypothetical protein
MKGLVTSAIEDLRVTLIFIFLIMILVSFFAALNKNVADERTKETLASIEKNSILSLETLYWGIGIAGTIGLIFTIVSFFKGDNGFGGGAI